MMDADAFLTPTFIYCNIKQIFLLLMFQFCFAFVHVAEVDGMFTWHLEMTNIALHPFLLAI